MMLYAPIARRTRRMTVLESIPRNRYLTTNHNRSSTTKTKTAAAPEAMAICVFCEAFVQNAPILSSPVGGGFGAPVYDVAIHDGG